MVKLVGKEVGDVGFGLMGLTWRAEPPPRDQAFAAMRAALANGANAWNGGELYGKPERNSLHLLNEYFTKYPEDAEKVVLCIKGGLAPGELRPDGSAKNVRRSIDECLKVLDGKKFLDLFECARLDHDVPVEETIGTIAEYVKAGKVGGISLSEVSAKTIRKIAKIHKVEAVEVEFSLWQTDILDNGIAEACAEFGIPIVAYSPLGRGFLTGQIKSFEDVPPNLRIFPRFQKDVFDENLKLVNEVQKLADKKGVKPSQIAIAWVKSHSGRNGLPTFLPIPGATTEERVKENLTSITLSDEDLKVLDKIIESFPVQGERYHPAGMAHAQI